MPRSVLVVEDDEANRLTLAVLLEDAGFRVDVAASFREAERKLRAEGAAYDLLLADQRLGDGEGAALAPILTERLPGARIVIVSGEARGGAFPHPVVVKGTRFSELLGVIERALA